MNAAPPAMITASAIEVIRGCGILPISRGLEVSMVLRSADVLAAEGISVIEVTLDSPDAYGTIAALRRQYGRLAVGAGTVRTREMAVRAADAGAQFLVSPSLEPEVIETAALRGLPMIAGAMTPTEIVQAYTRGSVMVKVFPAGPLGPDYIRLLLSPLKDIPLVPTGGVTAANAGGFIAAGAAAVGIGSSLLGPRAQDRAWLQAEAKALVKAVQEGRSRHA